MGQKNFDRKNTYDLVRHADGAVVSTLTLEVGCRILLSRDKRGVGHKKIQKDERLVSRATLVEMVEEMISKN